jgi:excisionase family DNA binding protein
MDDEIMTLGQVAAYFKISEQIIINMVKEGEISAFRIEDHWRIRKSDINDFIEVLNKG